MAVRHARGITRLTLARISGVPYSTIRELEVNCRQMRPTALAKLADALEVSLDFLLGREHSALPLAAALSVQALGRYLKEAPRPDEADLYKVAIQSESPVSVSEWVRLCELSDIKSALQQVPNKYKRRAEPLGSRKRQG